LFSPAAALQPVDPELAAAIIEFVLPFVSDPGQIESLYHQGGLPLARRWQHSGCRRSPVLPPPRNPSAACLRAHDDAHRIAVAAAFVDKLAGRRTVREFVPTPVPRELIEHCLRAASRANQQPWHFVAVGNAQTQRRIGVVAKDEERACNEDRASREWLQALAPLGTEAVIDKQRQRSRLSSFPCGMRTRAFSRLMVQPFGIFLETDEERFVMLRLQTDDVERVVVTGAP
jgi:hypothetical protein